MTKEERARYEKKATWQMWIASVTLLVGLGLLIGSFVVPPPGEIHPSVLAAFGEVLSFVGAIIGIDYSYKKKRLEYEEEK